MLNTNLNLIGVGDFDRFSAEESRAFIPFSLQYIIVAGGGGAAGGGTLKAGQAGSGGQILQGVYCVEPFATYSIQIGEGGIGGAVSGSLAITTGSNGQTSSFGFIRATGGRGGIYQNAVTLSFFGGDGDNGTYPASNGNGGSGSIWTINQAGPPFPDGYGGGGTGGDYLTSSYYVGGGAGFIIGPPTIEYMVVGAGGGGGAGRFEGGGTGGGGGWGGQWKLGSFNAYPSESYQITIGKGGINATSTPGPSSQGTGSYGELSSISGSIVTTPFFVTASGGEGGAGYEIGGGVGGGDVPYTASSNANGANGLQWLDGFYYGGGAGASRENPTPGNGIGGYGGGGNGGGSTSTGSVGGNDNTNYPFGIYSGPPGLPSQVPRSEYGYGMGAGGSGLRQLKNAGSGSGGNGIVALRYLGAPIATGGEIITSGSYTYHYFASSSTFNITLSDLLIRPGLPGESGAVTSSNAAPNTGGGAGAAFYNEAGANGGSGFVALRYEGLPLASGGEMVQTRYYTYHIYTSSGFFYPIGQESNPNVNFCTSQTNVDYIVIAGGGGGARSPFSPGNAGGGGAGGYITGSFFLENFVQTNIEVGAGGSGAFGAISPISGELIGSGSQGKQSSIANIFGATAIGGGGGGFTANPAEPSAVGGDGGSGGGNGAIGGGKGIPPQGNDATGSGGGGALTKSTTDAGGLGITWLDGVTYSQGGGGNILIAPGALNAGWGGQGNKSLGQGTPNYAQNGASGSVIFRYLGVPIATGGVVTQTGGYTYHTFTASGVFTPIP